MKIAKYLFPLILASCAQKPLPESYLSGNQIFPAGVYQQEIEVTSESKDGRKDLEFSGVVQKSEDQIVITGLSYGLTAFRITDDRRGNVKKEVLLESMKKAEPYIDYIYAPLKKLLLVENPNKDRQITEVKTDSLGRLTSFAVESSAGKGFVELSEYDLRKVPKNILLKTSYFQMKIELVKYTLKGP